MISTDDARPDDHGPDEVQARMEDTTAGEPHVQVQFTTKLEARWRVTDVPISLPTRLTRYGLSEVVNHLLGADPPRPFDFLVAGELLRGSLAKMMARLGVSGETSVSVEYVELVPPPQPEQSQAHPDWVSAVAPHEDGAVVLTGCYDHSAYVWDASGKQLAQLVGHTAAVKGVSWLQPGAAGGLRAVSAAKDHTLRVWRLGADGGETAREAACEAVCVAHEASVECVAANPAGSMFCSGGWDGSVHVWAASDVERGADAAPPSKKPRGKGSASAAPVEIEPHSTLPGNYDCTAALCWPTAALVYSGSWDGAVREWQVEAGQSSASLTGQKAVLCLDVSLLAATIATGHSDHTVRLWDARLQQQAQKLCLGHKGWVSAVAWSSMNANLLLSACHDGAVRLWDVRSTVPLHSLEPHTDKALCASWDGVERIISGGADGQLRVARAHLPTA